MKKLSKIMVIVLVITSLSITSVFAASSSYNEIVAPTTVKAGQVFYVELIGDEYFTTGEYNGQIAYSPDYWKMSPVSSGGYKSYSDYFFMYSDSGITLYSKVKVDAPGKYKITGTFNEVKWEEYDSDMKEYLGEGTWNINYNMEYTKTKTIEVLGQAKFKANGTNVKNLPKTAWFKYGQKFKTPTRKGYKFIGWATKKKVSSYYLTKKFNGEKRVTTYYAQWRKK
ncbi:MAG: hypothetical protein LBN74_07365 [Prevotella sp.]|jgi:hypothetical protein|nr:hypothetical protein [Prevotella sp.]